LKDPIRAARRALGWEARWIRWSLDRLRRREGSLTLHAEQGGPFARQAEAVAATLGCILIDQLGPAVEALEREARNADPFPALEEPDNDERQEGERR